MRFSIRRRIGRVKFSLVIGTITQVQGINSTLKDGGHILMWEFDEPNFYQIQGALLQAKSDYSLPSIYIAQSHPGGGFHAYSMVRMPWLNTVSIVSGTKHVDPGYVSMCAMRGHWTLRLSDKGQGAPQHICRLESVIADDVGPHELASFVNYEVWSTKRLLTLGKRGL